MEIADIKQQLTLSSVLHYYGLKPDKNLRLHCPFHEDKTPSLQVYYKTHTVYCFSSNCKTHGKSMDVIDFIMNKENIGKHEAIEKASSLIDNGQLKIDNVEKLSIVNYQLSIERAPFLQSMFTYFKNAVHNSRPAQDYIKKRSLDATRLEIGYNTAQFHHGTRRDETLISNCVAVGLLSPWGVNNRRPEEQAYKAFAKYCICFALRDKANNITGLYFRSTENNTDQKHYYLKNSTGLYPCYPDTNKSKLIITESIIDAASLLQIESINKEYNILAAYGTNRLNDEMKSAICELQQLTEIIFAFDIDEAGNKAALKYKEELQTLLPNVTFTKLILPNKDVNETLQLHDEQLFEALLKERTQDFSFSIEEKKETEKSQSPETPVKSTLTENNQTTKNQQLTTTFDTSNPYKLRYTTDTAVYIVQGSLPKTTDNLKIMLVIECKETGLKARNKIDLYEDKQTEKLCKEVSEKLNLRKDLLEADLYRLTDLLEEHIEKTAQQNTSEDMPLQVLTVKERNELETFAKKPKLIRRLNDLLGTSGIIGEDRNRIFLLIIAISHKMPETLHALIQGSSGSGKTRLLRQISDCMPQDKVTRFTRVSDKALYHYPENYFTNRLLVIEDADGLSEEAELAFRELQSGGELRSSLSVKLENGQHTGGEKVVKGPVASMSCTTRGELYEDNMSRVFLIAIDESTEQTKRIIQYQNCVASGTINREDEEKTKRFIQKFVSILEPCKVINPYAGKILLPEEAHKIRRLNDLFQSFVKMATIINQYQRKRDDKKRLITEIEDIETAVHIMFESIVLKVDELDGSLRQFFELLKIHLQKQNKEKTKNREFNLREIRQALRCSKMQVFRYVNDLLQLEYIKQVGGFANRGYTYKIIYWDNYEVLRERIKNNLYEQVKTIKEEKAENVKHQ